MSLEDILKHVEAVEKNFKFLADMYVNVKLHPAYPVTLKQIQTAMDELKLKVEEEKRGN